MANKGLNDARVSKNDEFYTSYEDIAKEMQYYLDCDRDVFRGKTILLPCDDPEQSNFTKYFMNHFEEYGIKRLISTCYSQASKSYTNGYQLSLYDSTNISTIDLNELKGKLMDATDGKCATIQSLKGNGDFRSREITEFRDEADMIITNPPFSLFREFMGWIFASEAQYSVLGSINAYTYPIIFPKLKGLTMQIGASITSGDREFRVPDNYPLNASGTRVDENGTKYVRVKGVRWFTNIPFRSEKPMLKLMTMDENAESGKHKELWGGYKEYDNLHAIEVPYTDAIPSDYDGLMGVPVTFLDKWNPDQFELVGTRCELAGPMIFEDGTEIQRPGILYISDKAVYDRIIIRKKESI